MTGTAALARTTVVPWRYRLLADTTATVALVVAVVGLLARRRVYGGETVDLSDAAVAQDLVTLLVAVPAFAVAMWCAARGSGRSFLVALGVLSFLAYNYAIYCFSITFGPLFLPWTALLGMSVFLLLAGVREAERQRLDTTVRPRVIAAVALCGVAALFSTMWLMEIVADTRRGGGSSSADLWHVPTNPVQVLDLAFFLPVAFIVGWFLWLQRRWALILAPVMLVFFALTSVPIVITPFVASLRGHDAAWAVAGPVGLIAVLSVVALVRVLERPE